MASASAPRPALGASASASCSRISTKTWRTLRAALLAREEAAGQERLRLVRAAVLGQGEGEPLEQLAGHRRAIRIAGESRDALGGRAAEQAQGLVRALVEIHVRGVGAHPFHEGGKRALRVALDLQERAAQVAMEHGRRLVQAPRLLPLLHGVRRASRGEQERAQEEVRGRVLRVGGRARWNTARGLGAAREDVARGQLGRSRVVRDPDPPCFSRAYPR